MVFVHARKETVKTAEMLKEMASKEGTLEAYDPSGEPQYDFHRRDVQASRNREMKELFQSGFGIHHAGMLRSDRNISERLFERNITKVLCCTATLAWGVNLVSSSIFYPLLMRSLTSLYSLHTQSSSKEHRCMTVAREPS